MPYLLPRNIVKNQEALRCCAGANHAEAVQESSLTWLEWHAYSDTSVQTGQSGPTWHCFHTRHTCTHPLPRTRTTSEEELYAIPLNTHRVPQLYSTTENVRHPTSCPLVHFVTGSLPTLWFAPSRQWDCPVNRDPVQSTPLQLTHHTIHWGAVVRVPRGPRQFMRPPGHPLSSSIQAYRVRFQS